MQEIRLIDVKEEILSENRDLADDTRRRLLAEGAFMLNLMGFFATQTILKATK